MAREAKMNTGNGRAPAAPRAMVDNLSDFAHDVVTLSELQVKLLAADLNDLKSGAVTPLALMGLAAVVALGAVPVLLMAVAWLLVDYDVLARGWAFLAAAGGGLVLALVMGLAGFSWLPRQLAVLERSRVELDRNVTWIKSVLKHSGRTSRDPREVIPHP
jgi:uncharacterized membrane protein YqjE